MAFQWIDTGQIAAATGKTPQGVGKAIKKARATGAPWNDATLIVREVKGQRGGGKSGVRYEVRLDSLPLGLQEALKASPKALPAPLEGQALVREWRFDIVHRAGEHPKGSTARADAILAICERPILNPATGRLETLAPDTVRRWLREYDERGLAALGRKKRADHGASKTIVTRKFDKAFKDKLDLEAARKRVLDFIRAQHKNLEGVNNIRWKASRFLETIIGEAGLEPTPGSCEVPMWLVQAEAVYRRVGDHHKDRKKFDDDNPGILRTIEGLWPMDIIVGDVHPLDFLLPEVEGLQRYAKAICWFDVATARLWATVVILPKGEGIRNEHVIASFKEMVSAWGLPKKLYLDNGSEYRFAEFIDDAMKLTHTDYKSALTRAKPYNARAKPIENRFRVWQSYLAKLPGYVGGNRMKAKTANVGRAPTPYHSLQSFPVMIEGSLAQYHAMPQSGTLAMRSPTEAFNQAVLDGWQKTEVDPDAFVAAFSTEETREVRQGHISVGGRSWTCDELVDYLGKRVIVVIPKFENWDRLPIKDERGRHLGFAEEDKPFAYDDVAGAKESSRRRGIRARALRDLDASAPSIDAEAELLGAVASYPKQLPAPVGARVTASDDARRTAAGVKESPKAKREREAAQRERDAEQQHALADEFFAKLNERKAG
jgi:hypothetical protein